MSFTTWSIRNPAPSILLFLILSLAGIYSFHHALIKNMPDFNQNRFTVALSLPGASPDELENEVAIPVENSFVSLNKLISLSSDISEGNVLLSLHFSHTRSVLGCLFDIRTALSRVRPYLPNGVQRARIHHESPSVGYSSTQWAVTSQTLSRSELTWFVKNTVYRAISSVPGERKFTIAGGVSRDVEVQISPLKLAALGLTVSEVTEALRSMEQESSGGEARIGGTNQGVRTVATAKTLEDLRDIPLTLPSGAVLPLGSIAHIFYGHASRSSVAEFDGKPAVEFRIYDEMGHNELTLIKDVALTVHRLAKDYPAVHFAKVRTERPDILSEYYQSIRMLLEGSILAVLVILIFLKNIRSTLIGAIALPLSILPTFIFIYFTGFGLNTITLMALLVVIGILVDDAIVEIENIYRHLKPGVSLREATASAVNEIGLAVTATTLALVVVFLPTSFMRGFSGALFREFGWTACVAVLVSLLVARLLTPILAIWLLRRDVPVHQESAIARLYARAVSWSVEHKITVLLLTTAIIGASVYLYTILPTGFIPPSEESYTTVNLRLSPGSTIQQALKAGAEVRRAILSKPNPVPGVKHIFTRVGDTGWNTNGGPGILTDIRKVTLTVAFTPRTTRPSEAQIEDDIREKVKNIPGMQISVNGSGFGENLAVTLVGANPDLLKTAAQAVESQMRRIKGLTGIGSSLGLGQTDITITPKPYMAAALGVSTADIARTIRVATSGAYLTNLPRLYLGDRRLSIRVELPRRYEKNLSAIRALRIKAKHGLVPLSAVATVSLGTVPLDIQRFDRKRLLTISADLEGMPLGEAFAKVSALPAMKHLPQGVRWAKFGENGLMAELFKDFGGELALASLFVYALLALLFKDPFQPITVICAAPLCLGGALLGVWISGSSINLPVFLGFILLLGLSTKNSILLIDYAQKSIAARGLSSKEAIIEACRIRARPILMTTVAMIAGMIPLMISIGGEDVSFSTPLAATVIGGLIGSTLLSLFVVPIVFLLVEWLKKNTYQRFIHKTL